MKKIDIEDMKRRMPYEVPKDFFSEMQENVLREIASKNKGKFRIQRIYWVVAASVAIIAGAGFLLLRNTIVTSTASPLTQSSIAVIQQTEKPATKMGDAASPESPDVSEGNKVAAVSLHNVTRENVASRKEIKPKAAKVVEPVEKMYNEAVNNLTSQELAEQSRRYEMDTYLDLY